MQAQHCNSKLWEIGSAGFSPNFAEQGRDTCITTQRSPMHQQTNGTEIQKDPIQAGAVGADAQTGICTGRCTDWQMHWRGGREAYIACINNCMAKPGGVGEGGGELRGRGCGG